jgi:hypothetical protein
MLTVTKGRPMNIKTPLAREFEKDVTQRLEIYSDAINKFKKQFNPKIHYISAEYTIYTPSDIIFTKDGSISSRSVDLDAHKSLQDTIFRFIGLDDKLVRDVRYHSPVSHDGKWNFVIMLNLEKIACLKSKSSLIVNTLKPMSDDSMSSALL